MSGEQRIAHMAAWLIAHQDDEPQPMLYTRFTRDDGSLVPFDEAIARAEQ